MPALATLGSERLIRSNPPVHSSIAKLYEQQLISDSILSASDAESFRKAHFASLDESLAAADPEKYQPPELEMPRGWNEMRWPQEGEWKKEVETGFDPKALREIGERSVQVPEDIVGLACCPRSIPRETN